MSRLIDADEFKKHYCKENCGERQCIDAMDKCIFIDCLDDFSTAFDVDDVVEELENGTHIYFNKITDELVPLAEVIEIVKRGGVNE